MVRTNNSSISDGSLRVFEANILSGRNILDIMSVSKEEKENIVLYIKKTKNASYPTKYGIEFQCVELIRRFFTIHKGITFPDVVDATDFFKRITHFETVSDTTTSSASASASAKKTVTPVPLVTCSYPYTYAPSHYLRPGSILFWKYKKTEYPYGHVAMIWKNDPTLNETYVVQQNLNPPIKRYNTTVLFSKMNRQDSKFAGVKLLPREYLTGIQSLECVVHRL